MSRLEASVELIDQCLEGGMPTNVAPGRAYRPDSNGRGWLKGGRWLWLKRKRCLMFVASLHERSTQRQTWCTPRSKHSKNNYINFFTMMNATYPPLNPRALWMGPTTSGYETADRETRFEVSPLSSLSTV